MTRLQYILSNSYIHECISLLLYVSNLYIKDNYTIEVIKDTTSALIFWKSLAVEHFSDCDTIYMCADKECYNATANWQCAIHKTVIIKCMLNLDVVLHRITHIRFPLYFHYFHRIASLLKVFIPVSNLAEQWRMKCHELSETKRKAGKLISCDNSMQAVGKWETFNRF